MGLGVAFAGGGVRGAAHLGIIQAMHEHNIFPQIFAGTSAGSIVASLLAYGYTPEQALHKFWVASENLIDIAYAHIAKGIASKKSSVEGFLAGNRLEKLLEKMFDGGTLNDIASPLGIVASDIDNGRQIIFSNKLFTDPELINDDNYLWIHNGEEKVSAVVRASSGIPPIFIPKRIHEMKLVDGGITNNLPSDIAWALGAHTVISLDLGYAGQVQTDGFIDISHMAINLLMERVTDGKGPIWFIPESQDL